MTSNGQKEQLRSIPSVDAVLRDARVGALAGELSLAAITNLVREVTETARNAVLRGSPAPEIDVITRQVLERAERTWNNWPQRVVNATGVVLHTNLGRAPMSAAAIEAAGHAAFLSFAQALTPDERRQWVRWLRERPERTHPAPHHPRRAAHHDRTILGSGRDGDLGGKARAF